MPSDQIIKVNDFFSEIWSNLNLFYTLYQDLTGLSIKKSKMTSLSDFVPGYSGPVTLDDCGDIDNTMALLYTSVDDNKVGLTSYQELGVR